VKESVTVRGKLTKAQKARKARKAREKVFVDKMIAIIEPVLAKMSPEEREARLTAFERTVDRLCAKARKRTK